MAGLGASARSAEAAAFVSMDGRSASAMIAKQVQVNVEKADLYS